ncbi:hypothetical protein [Halobacillus massiliensis]|uniref:hypothetical protein n=1 Tax=Halobacillus massiliensis TaxID=1926286 RepID=UPI0009E5153E|nr:hypothetical protein [Halobacillus massiliensis]
MSNPLIQRLILGFVTGTMIFLGFQAGLAITNNSGVGSILIAVFFGIVTRTIVSFLIKTTVEKNASL